MLITRSPRYRSQRRGVILIVVLSMLTLFTILGITFVLVANAQADSARLARQSETQSRPDIDPEAAFAFFLGQQLYDQSDDATGVLSSLRGHSLGRNMYGWNDATTSNNNQLYYTSLNDKPFNGTGRLSDPVAGLVDVTRPGWNNYAYLMNFRYYPADGFAIYPEKLQIGSKYYYTGGFNAPYTYPDHNNFYLGMINPGTGAIVAPSFHREYLFGRLDLPAPTDLTAAGAQVNWTNKIGKYLTLRPRPVDQLRQSDLTLGLSPQLLALNQWPLPLDQLNQAQEAELFNLISTLQAQGKIIAYPTDRYGDVKNFDGAPGGCDSIWIDINAPVQTTNDGRRYKMLVAPLILELDSRLDLNVIGNILGQGGDHRSHQGWGPWEINPKKVLNMATQATEWQRVFGGSGPGLARVPGRYDTLDPGPPPPGNPASRRPVGIPLGGGAVPRGWAQADYNARDTNTPNDYSIGYTLPPAPPSAGSYMAFPTFAATTFANGNAENIDHPALFSTWSPVFNPTAPPAAVTARNRRLPLSGMARLLRFGGTGSDLLTSDLLKLLPNNLVLDTAASTTPPVVANATAAQRRRNLLTLLSADLDAPGATPWVWDPNATGQPAFEPAAAVATKLQLFQAANTAQFTLNGNNVIPFPKPVSRGGTPGISTGTEFDGPAGGDSWRSLTAKLGRINLYRRLTDFPEAANGLIDLTNAANATAVQNAFNERQAMAKEIYDVLRAVTGAQEPNTAYVAYSAPNALDSAKNPFRTLRYLAQLAVNMVDFIDNDGYSTPFMWFSAGTVTEWVYGVEIPRLVINETYAQYDNDATPLVNGNVDAQNAKYNVNVWVELMNTLPNDLALSGRSDGKAFLQPGGYNPAGADHPYRILLCNEVVNAAQVDITNTVIRHPDNPEGDPSYNAADPTTPVYPRIQNRNPNNNADLGVRDWGDGTVVPGAAQVITPGAGLYDNYPRNGSGFYVLGPEVVYTPATTNPGIDTNYSNFKSPRMTYGVPANVYNNANKNRPTVVLQRLANPALPYNPNRIVNNAVNPLYNPYITIDVVDHTNDQVMDGRTVTTGGPVAMVPTMDERRSYGRTQPFAGVATQRLKQLADPPAPNPNANQPRHSFLRVNSDAETKALLDAAAADPKLKLPFDWLTHLDRIPISPAELLHVTHCRPSELTQFFVDAGVNFGTPHNHIAPWLSPTARLYRFFEFVHTAPVRGYPDPVAAWTAPPPATALPWTLRGRTPGRVNINGMWTREILRALADGPAAVNQTPSQGGNCFTEAQVDAIFPLLMASRSPGYNDTTGAIQLQPTNAALAALPNQAPGYTPTTNPVDKPFWSLALGAASPGATPDLMGSADRGTENTIFRGGGALFDVPGQTHPHKKKELLTKIFNHITTRSNVFAVWVTVGLFEVGPQDQIMGEIGKTENRHVRHRMFAIVDRTQMRAFTTTYNGANNINASPTPQAVSLNPMGATNILGPPALSFVRDVRTNRDWFLGDGALLTFDPNTYREETVTLRRDSNGVLTAVFTKPHDVGCMVICRGNPGPVAKYDPRQDNEVVPYFAIID